VEAPGDRRRDPRSGLRVLITNRILQTRTGTEVYVRDLAASLLRRGHLPIVYSPHLGEMAAEIRAGTVPVVDDLAQLGAAPDIIHGHHGLETLAALLAFPGVPAVAVCHSWLGWPDAPVHFPRVARYLAVDDTCRDRLVFEHGLPADRVHVRLNAIDLTQFQPRGPLPPRPARALVFGNSAGGAYLEAIEQACAAQGIAVEGPASAHVPSSAARRTSSASTTWSSPRANRRSKPRPSARPWSWPTSTESARW